MNLVYYKVINKFYLIEYCLEKESKNMENKNLIIRSSSAEFLIFIKTWNWK